MSANAAANDLRAFAKRLRDWDPAYPETGFMGQGIVICAGGARVFANCFVLLWVLRRVVGCALPIEVWHLGPEELSPAMRALLGEFEVRVVDALPLAHRAGAHLCDGWQLKSFAIQHSAFAEVLLLDADQVPVRDPAEVFAWPAYRDKGAVFWPDIVELLATNPVWNALDLPARQVLSFESGQVLVDKRRHWRAMCVVAALNQEADRLYRMIYGDKDTFLIGWELAGAQHALVPFPPFADERCLFQRDFAGAPLFQHRTNAKWSYAGKQHEIEGFVHAEACAEALEALRARWNGRVFTPPDRSIAARQAELDLAGVGRWRLDAVAEESLVLEFLPFGQVGEGRAADRLVWWCEEDGRGLGLVLSDTHRVTYRLWRSTAGTWTGTRYRLPEYAVELTPEPPVRTVEAGGPGLVDSLLSGAGFPHGDAAARAELVSALRLVCRVEPRCLARLESLRSDASPGDRGEYDALVAAVTPGAPISAVDRGMRLEAFYRFVGQDGLD
jgi:hypothetical protein